jgi:perosamine synthetase
VTKKIETLAKETVYFAQEIFGNEFIPLHRPVFEGNEKNYIIDCIDSNFVSSVGLKVTEFEDMTAKFTGANYAIATVNGTSALHIAIKLLEVVPGDEVITQSLTFVATCNAIDYAGAIPVFIDVDRDTMGMSPKSLRSFLELNAEKRKEGVFNKFSGRRIGACIPMHTFGFPCRIEEISRICDDWGIALIEDAAESLGSFYNKKHTGNFGKVSTLSFNGNKLITTGGGGMIITNDKRIAAQAKHITTTAKVPHAYEFIHNQIGYNYRMPNINAALGCAQLEKIDIFLSAKQNLANKWKLFFDQHCVSFVQEIKGSKANNWLNTIVLDSRYDRDSFLQYTNKNNVMTRPIWTLMSKLTMFKNCYNDGLKNSIWLEDRVVNVPSSVPFDISK